MSGFINKTALPLVCILGLAGCQNYFVKPSAIPSGYTYHDDQYKSPPSPEATNLGYSYSEEKNAQLLDSMRIKAEELFNQLENDYDMNGVDFFIYNAHEHNAQNSMLDTVLRDIVREKGYRIATAPQGAIGLGYSINEPKELEKDINFGDLQNDPKTTDHFDRINTYERMIMRLELTDGKENIGAVRAIYDMPMYGYERRNTFSLLKPIAGEHIDTRTWNK
jgi:hypothetical protein